MVNELLVMAHVRDAIHAAGNAAAAAAGPGVRGVGLTRIRRASRGPGFDPAAHIMRYLEAFSDADAWHVVIGCGAPRAP